MKTSLFTVLAASLIFCMGLLLPALGQESKPIQLPKPKLQSGKSLAQALKDRKTVKEYGPGKISDQRLANLLWAAWGINRPDSRRTAPSALNKQEIDVYVANAQGIYLYDAKGNALIPVVSGDNRSLTYTQVDRFKDAPLHLVYVADLAKMAYGEEAHKMILAAMDTGFIAQNAYLYCASDGLNTGFRVSIDKEKLGEAMKLKPSQRIMGAQSVGLPKRK